MSKSEGRAYWSKRADFVYYHYIDHMVRTVGATARRLIDVGSRNCGYLEWFDWIEYKLSIDLSKPYVSDTVRGLQMDFLDYRPETHFDLVLCLQVLEHVPDPELFVDKLFAIGDKALISVPYKWSASNPPPGHIHDPVDKEKLKKWTKRDPDYSVVVEEPFRPESRRLIAYYDIQEPGRAVDKRMHAARRPTRFY